MAKQDVKKSYTNAILDLDEMIIYEYSKDGDMTGKFSLQFLLEDIANSGHSDINIAYKSAIIPDEE